MTAPDLAALRAAARSAVDVPGDRPVHWRVVQIEYYGGVAPVCTATEYAYGEAAVLTHVDPTTGTRIDDHLYDCCPGPYIEVYSDSLAAYLIALLNADADRAETEAPTPKEN